MEVKYNIRYTLYNYNLHILQHDDINEQIKTQITENSAVR